MPSDLVRHWHHGWSLARGFAPATEDAGVLRTVVGTPGRDVERLVLDADTHPRRIDRAALDSWADRDPWVSVPTTDPGRTADRLLEHGLVASPLPSWLMTVDLAEARRVDLLPAYAVDLVRDLPDVVELRVLDAAGRLAASGQAGIVEGRVVPDKITTEPDHRRRGLGAAVMTLLGGAARERGVHEGVLVASDEGRRLYLHLGWRLRGAVVVSRRF